MPAEEIHEMTLDQLRETRLTMMSSRWLLELRRNPDKKQESADTLLEVNSAILELENAELADIRERLEENEDDLREGVAELEGALASVDNFSTVLTAATRLLVVVARVVALV